MQIRRDFLRSLEAAIVGLFLVQSIRYLYATLFAHVSSADLVRRVNFDTIRGLPGVVDPDSVQREIIAVSATLLAPLLALILARTRWSIPLAVAFCAIGRTYTLQLPESGVLAAAVVVASGLLYMTLLAIRRPRFFPVMLTAGFAGDQIIRAMNATADPTFNPDYRFILFGRFELQLNEAMIGIALALLVLTAITTLVEREEARLPGYRKQPPGYLTGWGGLALGGILFLEFTLLSVPNAVARWAHMDYYLILPMILTATTLTLVPEVRSQAGRFLSIFDGSYRGWLWALLLALLLVIAKRFDGITAALALSIAQFLAILTLWWLVKQPEERRYINPTPILVLLGAVVFVLLTVGDYFTYNYAYVTEIAAPFSIFEDVLRGMREMGLALALFAAILACMPMILERQIIPWREGRILETILTLALVLIVTISATRAAVPAPLRLPFDPNCLRIASLNIESGYTPFFAPNLEEVAQLILESGADVVLLQEVEAGFMSSGGIDQALWLADRTNMNATFFPQIETLHGLAVLSRLNVSNEAGYLLSSIGAQAGVQYVRYSLDQSGDLHIYNAWLNYPQETVNNVPVPEALQDQAKQMDELYNLVARNHFVAPTGTPDRVVVGGSFNVAEGSPLYLRWEETVFEDPFTSLFAERRNTLYLINGESARWDYLWTLNLRNSGSNIIQEAAISKRRMSVVAVGREANQACPA